MMAMDIGALREGLVTAMDRGGAWGRDLHESKPVLIDVGGQMYELDQAAVTFAGGRFALVLRAGAAAR